MTLHFSELFKLSNQKIKPRFEIEASEDIHLKYALKSFEYNDLKSFTNSYFEVKVVGKKYRIIKIYLN